MMMSRKKLLEKPRFELAAKSVFRLGRPYILCIVHLLCYFMHNKVTKDDPHTGVFSQHII